MPKQRSLLIIASFHDRVQGRKIEGLQTATQNGPCGWKEKGSATKASPRRENKGQECPNEGHCSSSPLPITQHGDPNEKGTLDKSLCSCTPRRYAEKVRALSEVSIITMVRTLSPPPRPKPPPSRLSPKRLSL